MLYHGTTARNAQLINKESFSISIPNLVNLNYTNRKTKMKEPGSLGYGLYTFLDNRDLAFKFANKFTDSPAVVYEIKVNIDEDSLLDLTCEKDQHFFREFIEEAHNCNQAKQIHKKISSKTEKVDVFAGIATELFINYARTKGTIYKGVKKATETFVEPLEPPRFRLGIPNGIEFAIRDKKIIKHYEVC